jgi:acyl-CoA thioesterase
VHDLDAVLDVLDLRPAGEGRFQGHHLDGPGDVVFGGQLLAQTVVAAGRAVPGKDVLSLQAAFARGATRDEPVDVAVDVAQSGRSFANVTVTMAQRGKVCCRSLALLHAPDADLVRHGAAAPAVPPPGDLPERPNGEGWWDLRIIGGVDLADADAVGPAELEVWSRFPGAPDDVATGQALLAYASDGFLIGTAMRPHAGLGQSMAHVSVATTVLTHTIAFHEPFRAADWLLLAQTSTHAGRGRCHGRAEVFDTAGRHVASFSQTALLRAMAN